MLDLIGIETIHQNINWYFHLVSFCEFNVGQKLSDDVVFYSVILNKCQTLCIYILSYLYTVTLYSELLLLVMLFSF